MIRSQPKKKKLIGKRNGLNVYSTLQNSSKLKSKTTLKTKTKIKATSKERYAQQMAERELKKQLLERCHGLCECCHCPPDFRGLSKHEKIFRSHGGDALDPENCEMLCGRCHSMRHGIIER